jgi:hypothetical protein
MQARALLNAMTESVATASFFSPAVVLYSSALIEKRSTMLTRATDASCATCNASSSTDAVRRNASSVPASRSIPPGSRLGGIFAVADAGRRRA